MGCVSTSSAEAMVPCWENIGLPPTSSEGVYVSWGPFHNSSKMENETNRLFGAALCQNVGRETAELRFW